MIDVLASQPHYLDHLAPIVLELRQRGREVNVLVVGSGAELRAHELGLGARPGVPRARDGAPVLVASARDYGWTAKSRRIAYLEHGAGQTYLDNTAPGYAGSTDMDRVELVLSTGPRSTRLWKRAYPEMRVEEVGAPKLDLLLLLALPRTDVVGFTFHWQCRRSTESGTAWFDWRDAVRAYVAEHDLVLGHWHPKWGDTLERWWTYLNVPVARHSDAILLGPGVLVADNTSLLYEFAALGKPVLCLNAAKWRKDVEHGLRFWGHVPGLQLDPGADLGDGIEEAREDSNLMRHFRERAVAEVYGDTLDGRATERAADVIEEWAWSS